MMGRCALTMPDSSANDLYLVRHGETAWSGTGQHTGLTDLPLTARGEEQARELARRLEHVRFDHVFSSPLRRAFSTCEIAGFAAAATIDPALVEWNYGDYEGLTRAQIQRERPGWELFRDGCPGGESTAQISLRVDRLLARLQLLDGTVLLFSSGHLLRVLTARWLGYPAEVGRSLLLDPAGVCVLGVDRDERVIRLWNDVQA